MPIFAMPVIIMIEADSPEEAQSSLEDWKDEVSIDDSLPLGTDEIDINPHCELSEEDGQRIIYLPSLDIEQLNSEESMHDGADDFNDSSADF